MLKAKGDKVPEGNQGGLMKAKILEILTERKGRAGYYSITFLSMYWDLVRISSLYHVVDMLKTLEELANDKLVFLGRDSSGEGRHSDNTNRIVTVCLRKDN